MSLTQLLNHTAAHFSHQQRLPSLMTPQSSTLIKSKYFWLSLPIAVIVNASLDPDPKDSSALAAFSQFDAMTQRPLASGLVFRKRARCRCKRALRAPFSTIKLQMGHPTVLFSKDKTGKCAIWDTALDSV